MGHFADSDCIESLPPLSKRCIEDKVVFLEELHIVRADCPGP
jgi:hypothetical protein